MGRDHSLGTWGALRDVAVVHPMKEFDWTCPENWHKGMALVDFQSFIFNKKARISLHTR